MNTQQNVNNKQTVEEIQQEVWKKTEADFEKRRKWGIWSLIYQIPIGTVLGGFAFLASMIGIREKIAFLIISSIILWFAMFVSSFILISEKLQPYNILGKLKKLKIPFKEKLQERVGIERRLTARKTKLASKNNLLSWMCSLPKAIPDQKWGYYITSMIRLEEEQVKKLQQAYDVLDEEIVRLNPNQHQ